MRQESVDALVHFVCSLDPLMVIGILGLRGVEIIGPVVGFIVE